MPNLSPSRRNKCCNKPSEEKREGLTSWMMSLSKKCNAFLTQYMWDDKWQKRPITILSIVFANSVEYNLAYKPCYDINFSLNTS